MKDYLRLFRAENLVFIIVLLWVMTYWVAAAVLQHCSISDVMPVPVWLLMTMSVVCIAAGGYVVNDYFDVKIDRINRPDHLVVTRTVSKDSAMRLFYIFTIAGVIGGLVCAWILHSMPVALVYLLVPGLLWFYSASYKRMLLVGNIIVSFVTALVPLLVAMVQQAWLVKRYGNELLRYIPVGHDLYVWLGGFALFAFLCTWAREMVKDLQDQSGDREYECHTMPIVAGDRWTQVCVTLLLLVVAALAAWLHWGHVMPFETSFGSSATRYILFGLYVPIVCEIALLWSARIPSDYRSAQLLLKFIMFIGTLFAFVIYSSL